MDRSTIERLAQKLEESGVHFRRAVRDRDYVGDRAITEKIPWETVLVKVIMQNKGWSLGETVAEGEEVKDEPFRAIRIHRE